MSTISHFVSSSHACLSPSSLNILHQTNPLFFAFYNTAFKSQNIDWSSSKFSSAELNLFFLLDKYEGFNVQDVPYFLDYIIFSNGAVVLLVTSWG